MSRALTSCESNREQNGNQENNLKCLLWTIPMCLPLSYVLRYLTLATFLTWMNHITHSTVKAEATPKMSYLSQISTLHLSSAVTSSSYYCTVKSLNSKWCSYECWVRSELWGEASWRFQLDQLISLFSFLCLGSMWQYCMKKHWSL